FEEWSPPLIRGAGRRAPGTAIRGAASGASFAHAGAPDIRMSGRVRKAVGSRSTRSKAGERTERTEQKAGERREGETTTTTTTHRPLSAGAAHIHTRRHERGSCSPFTPSCSRRKPR